MLNERRDEFDARGAATLPPLLTTADCAAFAPRTAAGGSPSGGNRCLLRQVWCADLARRLAADATLALRERLGEVPCPVEAGGALVMKPLLLHASSKSRAAGRRRVLHFLYGPATLPHGLCWPDHVRG